MKDNKHRVTLTKEEIDVLAHITRHFSDYIHGDDRPDHGMGILKGYREASQKFIRENTFATERTGYLAAFFSAMGKMNRFSRKLKQ